jgi:hypothetical protein
MNYHLSSQFLVLKGLNMNNPVRSAGESTHQSTTALKGLNGFKLIFNPFRVEIVVLFFPCVLRTAIQIQPFQG